MLWGILVAKPREEWLALFARHDAHEGEHIFLRDHLAEVHAYVAPLAPKRAAGITVHASAARH
jgi:hypothetical protein